MFSFFQIVNLEYPYVTSCIKNRKLEKLHNTDNSYSKPGCLMQCLGQFVIARCGCRPVEYRGDILVYVSGYNLLVTYKFLLLFTHFIVKACVSLFAIIILLQIYRSLFVLPMIQCFVCSRRTVSCNSNVVSSSTMISLSVSNVSITASWSSIGILDGYCVSLSYLNSTDDYRY